MTHSFNPIIERTDLENRRFRDGSYVYPQKFFASCSCGWRGWWGSLYVAEDAWIDHIENPDQWLGE